MPKKDSTKTTAPQNSTNVATKDKPSDKSVATDTVKTETVTPDPVETKPVGTSVAAEKPAGVDIPRGLIVDRDKFMVWLEDGEEFVNLAHGLTNVSQGPKGDPIRANFQTVIELIHQASNPGG